MRLEFDPDEVHRWGPDPLLTMFGMSADVTVVFEAAGGRDRVSGVLAALTDDALLIEQHDAHGSEAAYLIPRSRVMWLRAEFTLRE